MMSIIRLAFNGNVDVVLSHSMNRNRIEAYYRELQFSEEDFDLLTELLRKATIASKVVTNVQRLK